MAFTVNQDIMEWHAILVERGACTEGKQYVLDSQVSTFGELVAYITADDTFPYDWAIWLIDYMEDTLPVPFYNVLFQKGFRGTGRPDFNEGFEGAQEAIRVRASKSSNIDQADKLYPITKSLPSGPSSGIAG